MAGKGFGGNAVPVSDLAAAILDPVLRKRTGMSVALVQSWEEIAGVRLAQVTRPEKIVWPRRMHEDDPFEPAALVVACEGMAALRLQHETGELIARVNAFLGYPAIGRIRIVQKPMARGPAPKSKPRVLSTEEQADVAARVSGVEDEALRAALERLGRTILAAKRKS